MQPIYTQTVGAGGASGITFNNIPQTFSDLKVEISARGSSGSLPALFTFFNGDATTTNSFTQLFGNGSSAASSRASSYPVILGGVPPAASETSNTFSNSSIYIPNYTSANFKQSIVDSVAENNATAAYLFLAAGLYRSTLPVSSITMYLSPGNFVQHSTFTLYGITKG